MPRIRAVISRFSFLCVALLVSLPAFATIPQPERDALIALYNSTNGPGWTNSTNWLGAPGTECTWFGVACSAPDPSHVSFLYLPENNLEGQLPAEFGILHLPVLAWTSSNDFVRHDSGFVVEDLLRLTYLSLISNRITGPVPSWLGELKQLQVLFWARTS